MDESEVGLEFEGHQVDGSSYPRQVTGKELIQMMFGEDHGAPIRRITISAKAPNGKTISIGMSNDDTGKVSVDIR